jgi:hypothetical protein
MKYRSVVVILFASLMIVPYPGPVRASEEGRRNTAYGLGIGSLYLLSRRDTRVLGVLGLGGTAYATKLMQDDINARHRREKAAAKYRTLTSAPSSQSLGSSSRVQSLISSAYRKGMAEGYKSGYREGLVIGQSGRGRQGASSVTTAPAPSSNYQRVLAAMNR